MDQICDQNNSRFRAALREFDGARLSATLETIMAYITGKSIQLLDFKDVCQQLKVEGSTFRGLRDIPLNAIVGSVGRYADFTRSFWPRRDNDKHRWASVKAAMSDTVGLPPIDVYQIGPIYFVIDGHHRVSAARQLGDTHIQANVTEVYIETRLSAEIQPDKQLGTPEQTKTTIRRLKAGTGLGQWRKYLQPVIRWTPFRHNLYLSLFLTTLVPQRPSV